MGGPFLGTEEATWAISSRERLHAAFVQGTCALARECEDREHWARACELYRRAIELDDLAEELYQRLMICQQRLGQRGEALSTYQRCKRSLARHLGVRPGSKTRELYERMLEI